MPLDLVQACAVTCALAGAVGVGIAILVSFECRLRISEVDALSVGDIVDHRALADPVGQGVAVYLRSTKTGRRQAVMIEDSTLASLLVEWQSAVSRVDPTDSLFPSVAVLRDTLGRALRALDDGSWETPGLRFVWHSLRHGGASRAFLRGGAVVLPDLLVRGRVRPDCIQAASCCSPSRCPQRSRLWRAVIERSASRRWLYRILPRCSPRTCDQLCGLVMCPFFSKDEDRNFRCCVSFESTI